MTELAVAVAVLLSAAALQMLARLVQARSTDLRSPGPLIDVRHHRQPTVRPLDFDQLEGVVADGLGSDTHMARNLLPLLDGLAAAAPGEVTVKRPGRLGKGRWLADTLDDLERAWGISDRLATRREPRASSGPRLRSGPR